MRGGGRRDGHADKAVVIEVVRLCILRVTFGRLGDQHLRVGTEERL
jgi:hypothetical protein